MVPPCLNPFEEKHTGTPMSGNGIFPLRKSSASLAFCATSNAGDSSTETNSASKLLRLSECNM